MARMGILLSHCPAEKDVAERVATALRGAGADVWVEEWRRDDTPPSRADAGQLRARPVFIPLLSPAALTSDQVKRDCERASSSQMRDPSRIILPVVVAPIAPNAMGGMRAIERFRRIEGPDRAPLPQDEMIARLLDLLALTSTREASAPMETQVSATISDLLIRGAALAARERWTEALDAFQRAVERDPDSSEGWGLLGQTLSSLNRYTEALAAYDRAQAVNDRQAWIWTNKGVTLDNLGRYQEALAAFDRALALDPGDTLAWVGKGDTLDWLGWSDRALAAYDRALALDSDDASAWYNKGVTLYRLGRRQGALDAFDHALALDPENVHAWINKGAILDGMALPWGALEAYDRALDLAPNDPAIWSDKGAALDALGRCDEALEAYDHALALDSAFAAAWFNKGVTLERLKRYEEALAAFDRGFDRANPQHWSAHARVYRALGRKAEAKAAERRAQELSR